MEQLNRQIEDALKAGIIYNVDFLNLKDRANRQLEHACDRYRDAAGRQAIDWEDVPSYLNHVTGKLKLAQKKAKTNPAYADWADFLKDWADLAAKLDQLKGLVVKGKKPSDRPRQSMPRTLDNTGTCPICGQNVKMNDGRLVAHGFRLHWGQRNGNCFGVGRQPWEVSPEGAIAYRKVLAQAIEGRERILAEVDDRTSVPDLRRKMVDRTDPRFPQVLERFKGQIRGELRQLASDDQYFMKRIEGWTPQPLPGQSV